MTRTVIVSAEGSEHVEPVEVEEHPDGWITTSTTGAGTGWGDGPVALDGVPHDAMKQPDGGVLFRRR
jgi:hypothetical protein